MTLPPAVENYFAGKNARDFARAVSGFAPSVVVKDEARDHRGPAAIQAWIEKTAAEYDDRTVLKSAVGDDGSAEVLAEVSGTFPGSPILLRFRFALDAGRITHLEIKP